MFLTAELINNKNFVAICFWSDKNINTVAVSVFGMTNVTIMGSHSISPRLAIIINTATDCALRVLNRDRNALKINALVRGQSLRCVSIGKRDGESARHSPHRWNHCAPHSWHTNEGRDQATCRTSGHRLPIVNTAPPSCSVCPVPWGTYA